MARLLAALTIVTLFLPACAPNGEGQGEPSPAATPTRTVAPTPTGDEGTTAATNTCRATGAGYEVEYPADWQVNDPTQDDTCRWFHPEPFELPEASEALEIAISLSITDATFDEIVEATLESPHGAEILSHGRTSVAGGQALRVESRATGETLLPEGTLAYRYLVDFDGRVLVATTSELAEAGTYEENREVLDEMMRSLRKLDEAAQACSASGLPADPQPQEGLPQAVAQTREAIVDAAVSCDYERLAELTADADGGFSYSFGESGNAAEYWRRQEADGREPLRFLVGILDRPHARQDVSGHTRYVWPSAFAYPTWEEVPQEDREALKPLYDEDDFEDFRRFGSYIGYRASVTERGQWVTFVAGD